MLIGMREMTLLLSCSACCLLCCSGAQRRTEESAFKGDGKGDRKPRAGETEAGSELTLLFIIILFVVFQALTKMVAPPTLPILFILFIFPSPLPFEIAKVSTPKPIVSARAVSGTEKGAV